MVRISKIKPICSIIRIIIEFKIYCIKYVIVSLKHIF